jgi:dienelactone hydrolase
MNLVTTATGLVLFTACFSGAGEVKSELLKYTADRTVMRGYLAYPADIAGRRPAILIFSEWWGLNAYARRRANELAALGYVALAADMYGEGQVATNAAEAGALAGILRGGDRAELRKRAAAALAALRGWEHTDAARIGAMGYCFGGTVALEMARSGADLRGVVSFHGGLDTPRPASPGSIKAAVLVCHGADDPFNSKAVVDAFQDELRRADADWQMVFYGGAVHSFTNPDAGNDKAQGVAYDAKADHRSWDLLRAFFREVLGEPRG